MTSLPVELSSRRGGGVTSLPVELSSRRGGEVTSLPAELSNSHPHSPCELAGEAYELPTEHAHELLAAAEHLKLRGLEDLCKPHPNTTSSSVPT